MRDPRQILSMRFYSLLAAVTALVLWLMVSVGAHPFASFLVVAIILITGSAGAVIVTWMEEPSPPSPAATPSPAPAAETSAPPARTAAIRPARSRTPSSLRDILGADDAEAQALTRGRATLNPVPLDDPRRDPMNRIDAITAAHPGFFAPGEQESIPAGHGLITVQVLDGRIAFDRSYPSRAEVREALAERADDPQAGPLPRAWVDLTASTPCFEQLRFNPVRGMEIADNIPLGATPAELVAARSPA